MPARKTEVKTPRAVEQTENLSIENESFAKSIERAAEICAEKGACLNVTIYNFYQQGVSSITNNYYGIKSDYETNQEAESQS